MDALLMCGGRGTRLDAGVEKPLVRVGGTPMVDRVLDALASSRVDRVTAVASPHAPATRERLAGRADVDVVDAPGDGYVDDLGAALDAVGTPALTVAADLPLLDGDAVDTALDAWGGGSLVVCVPASLKRDLGVSVDASFERNGRAVAPTGLNVVAEAEDTIRVSDDERLAVNVNRPADLALAEELCD